jgi:hypothetical protein
MVDAEDYPAILYLPVFYPPGALDLVPPHRDVLPPWANYLKDTVNKVREKYGVQSVSPPLLGVHHFYRMLAKIAHGFGVAHLGMGNLDFLLPPLILGAPDRDPLWFIGCDPPKEPIDYLHQVDLELHRPTALVTARIRLFARYGAPIYRVVVGRPNALTPPI